MVEKREDKITGPNYYLIQIDGGESPPEITISNASYGSGSFVAAYA